MKREEKKIVLPEIQLEDYKMPKNKSNSSLHKLDLENHSLHVHANQVSQLGSVPQKE